MNNVYSRKLSIPFSEAVARLMENLNRHGFGIITNINVKNVLKEKLNIDFRNYTILGVCNPEFAYKAISLESHVGTMLPCSVVVQQHENGEVEISAMNPLETIDKVLATSSLNKIATQVSAQLRAALDDFHRQDKEPAQVDAIPQPPLEPVLVAR